MARPLRIVFVAPAYWPATAFGGPIPVMRALALGLTALGHRVDVLTTTLTGTGERPPRGSSVAEVDGTRVRYLGTPLRFRWFGFTPALARELGALPRPDIVHVFGFRDYVGTMTARWCRKNGVPYVFEALGMFTPKLRKVLLKRGLDSSLYRNVARAAALVIAASEVESRELQAVVAADRIAVRPNPFPAPYDPPARPGPLRTRLDLDASAPLVLSVGRVARGKGLEQLVAAAVRLEGVQLAIAGPDDGQGVSAELLRLRDRLGASGRVHVLGHVDAPLELYGDADVLVLASAHESFGMVAAEAAAAGTASIVTDRCGVAELLRERGALVIPYDEEPLRAALKRLLEDEGLRAALGRGGREVAAELSTSNVARLQAEIYERGRVTDLAVVTQDPLVGGGAVAQTQAFVRAAAELDREPTVLHPRFVPLADSLALLAESRRIARAVREARSAWVVAAAAPYGFGATRSGRPYAAWIGTSLDREWAARRRHLAASRRLALELNAPLLRRLERRVLRGAKRLYATSPSSRRDLAAAAGIEPGTIGILPLPVDTEMFRPEHDDEWLARLERPTVVFVGRADDPRKNVRLLLEAWPHVRARRPDALLRLVGRPPAGLLVAGVEAVGQVASVAEELRRSSVFVLPSLQEGFGIVVAEALASGIPVVVTPCGGPEELVRESGGGTVVSDFEPRTLAAAIVSALGDPQRLAEQRAAGRSYVETRHSPARLRTELAAAFAELCDA